MKSCVNCGAQIEDQNKFCPHCGTKCEDAPVGTGPVNNQETMVSVNDPVSESEGSSIEQGNLYPMKWHNFQMVIMILGGILTFANGMNTLMGNEYIRQGLDSSRVYSVYPGLKSCDVFYGIVLIGLGVFEFIVRGRLNKFQANGPGSLKTLYILSIVGSLIYMAWASSATGISMFDSSNLGSIGSSVLFMIINSIYYSKRSSLFVN